MRCDVAMAREWEVVIERVREGGLLHVVYLDLERHNDRSSKTPGEAKCKTP